MNAYFVEFFKQFFDGDCKKADVSQVLSVAQQINKLGQGKYRNYDIKHIAALLCHIFLFVLAIEILNAELQKQVLANHEDLLSQATWVEKLEGVLSIMQSHVQVNTTFKNIDN